MADPSFHTTQLRAWLARLHDGDLAARDEVLRATGDRLERLARKMLTQFPRVQRWAETDDVLQGALLRLVRSLEAVSLASTREFFQLAAAQIRRELLDLARHYYGPRGLGANHASQAPGAAPEPLDRDDNADEFERWCAFHEAVEALPAEEREVVSLIYYHDWKQTEVADLLGVTARTVQRRWQGALLKVRSRLQRAE